MATTVTTSQKTGGGAQVRSGQHALAVVGGKFMLLCYGSSTGGDNGLYAFSGTKEDDFAAAGTVTTNATITMGRTALLDGGWSLLSTGAFGHFSYGGGTTWSAGTGTAIAGFAAYSGFKGAEGNWHAVAAPAGAGAHICNIYAATTLGGAWTLLSNTLDLGTALSNSGNDCILALPNNGKVLVVAITTVVGTNLVYALTEPLTQTTVSGSTWGTASTIGATTIPTQSNNLSGVTDNGGRSWIALNDGAGVIVYTLPAGGAWSSALRLSSLSTDQHVAMCMDGNGVVWAFWIDNNGAIWAQDLQYAAGPALIHPKINIVANNSVARQKLVAANAGSPHIMLSWVETTSTPNSIVVHAFLTQWPAADTGSGADTPQQAFAPTIIDQGQAAEPLTQAISGPGPDSATAIDSPALGAALGAADAAMAREILQGQGTLPVESGLGVEGLALAAALGLVDIATVFDSVGQSRLIQVGDGGLALDTFPVQTVARGGSITDALIFPNAQVSAYLAAALATFPPFYDASGVALPPTGYLPDAVTTSDAQGRYQLTHLLGGQPYHLYVVPQANPLTNTPSSPPLWITYRVPDAIPTGTPCVLYGALGPGVPVQTWPEWPTVVPGGLVLVNTPTLAQIDQAGTWSVALYPSLTLQPPTAYYVQIGAAIWRGIIPNQGSIAFDSWGALASTKRLI